MLNNQQPELKIAEAILQIASLGKKPSQGKVIKLIGGSYSTVGPIFNKIKADFNDFADLDKLCRFYKLKKADPGKLVTENDELKRTVKILEEHNLKLETSNLELNQKLTVLENSKNYYEGLYRNLDADREKILAQIKAEKDVQISSLLDELAATHRSHTDNYRNFSFKHEDKLIQKEITVMDLKSKLSELQLKLDAIDRQSLPQIKLIKTLRTENAELVNKLQALESRLGEKLSAS